MWNWNAREATAAFGYDYILRQCRLRGRVDTDGKVTTSTKPAQAFCIGQCADMQSVLCVGRDLIGANTTVGALQVAAYLEERLNVGVNFLLSAELDHIRKDFKFGFGLTVGE